MAGRQVWNELVRTTAQLLTPLSSNPGGATTLLAEFGRRVPVLRYYPSDRPFGWCR